MIALGISGGGAFPPLFVAFGRSLCYRGTMKKIVSLLLFASLCLSLCACGRKETLPAGTGQTSEYPLPTETISDAVQETPVYTHYDSIEITRDNWNTYFEICEIPLFILNPNGGIREMVQNYCVALREEFAHRMRTIGAYQVDFTIGFDVYVETLDIDLDAHSYAHTSDMLYALRAEHNCAFTARALPKSAAGGTYADYLTNLAPAYRNAFFSGSAHYTDGVWAGFYVDLNTVEVVSVQGTLELLY